MKGKQVSVERLSSVVQMVRNRRYGAMGPVIQLVLLATLSAAFQVAGDQPRPNREPGADGDVGWRMLYYGTDSPSFIPEALFAGRSLEEIGFTKSEISRIEGLKDHEPPYCQRLYSRTPRAQSASLTIEEALAREPVAFVARVERIVPGLSDRQLFVGNAVYLRVETVLHGEYPRAGDLAAIVLAGATMTLDGTSVCTHPEEGIPQPLVGDRLVVSGSPSENDPVAFDHVLLFPIVADEVMPVDSSILAVDAQPVPVGQLVPDLREEEKQ